MRRLVTCLFICAIAFPAYAQHAASRLQWQPHSEHDLRLEQRITVEIIGRSAVSGLAILSEKTDVSLGVAPEDLTTVGERKFTVITKGLDLKSIMMQLSEALQECHWDVDTSGPELTYYLHRNSGTE